MIPTVLALFAVIFETPLAAAAAAGGAVSIPIIIHLLNRRRFRVVTWAAMRFLLAAQRKNARKMRLEQLLLLIVRCAIVLLLVLAMASVTPWAEAVWHWVNPEGGLAPANTGRRTHKIVVVDGSFSMGLRVGETTCFERARALAARLVRESGGGDGFSVVLMAEPPRRIVPEPSEDSRKVVGEVENLRLTHGNADLAATLATVESLVSASPGKYADREVYLLTDLQQSTWIARQPAALSASLAKIQARARTIFVDVGQDNAPNIAVTSLALGESLALPGREVPVIATVQNFGPPKHDVPVRLYVGKARSQAGERPAELHEVGEVLLRDLEHGQPTNVSFKYAFPRAGDYVLQVQVQHDGLELDDLRSAVISVKNTVPVLLVNGKPAAELYDRATEWLRTALKPFGDTEETVVTPKVISAAQFADPGLVDLSAYDCVFLCDVPRFSPPEVRRLEAHVRRGGSAVFSVGDQVDVGAWNDALYRDGKGLLPARLIGKAANKPGWNYLFSIDPDADREGPLKPFRNPSARERLVACRFWDFLQVEPAPKAGPRTVLRFAPVKVPGKGPAEASAVPPGGAAVLEWQPPVIALEETKPGDKETRRQGDRGRMRGRVVLITTTLNADWNNWPTSPSYPPLMHEVLYHAAGARLREQAVAVGEPLELFLPDTKAGLEATIRTPDGRTETVQSQAQDEASALRWGDTDISGVYSLSVGQAPREYLFAVNVPAVEESQQTTESDLTRTSREELQKTYPEWDVQIVTDLGQVKHLPLGSSSSEPEMVIRPLGPIVARWLLLAVLVLVLAEVIMAWRFGHYSGVALEEAARPQTRGKRWAMIGLPAFFLICAAGLGLVLAHDAWTGDFLGFLPDGMRRGVESFLGVPPPAPGEGSHWRLELSSYFYNTHADPWLAGFLALAAGAMICLIYRRERTTATPTRRDQIARVVRMGLRLCLLGLLLAVLLPQLRLWFERQGWPDVAIVIDDSQSMSTVDRYRDPKVQEVADQLAKHEGLTKGERLHLAQALVARSQPDWVTALLTQRQVRVHVYRCSARAHRLADVTEPGEIKKAVDAVNGLTAGAENDSSQLGAAVRQVLNDFRGSSLAAVVMLTDGVVTEGEDLPKVGKYAHQMGVPLYFVGIGDAHEVRDVYLHDLQAPESVFINDTIVFQVRLTAQGYNGLTTTAVLREKGSDKVLQRVPVQVEPGARTVKVQLTHKPTTPGEKIYEVETPLQPDEVDKDNNRLEKPVYVHEARLIKVLYIEGYRRYEYHYLKTLLERESNRIKGNKVYDLKVLLLDADPDFVAQDRSAISEFPARAELNTYDVVILGDVGPHGRGDPKMNEHMKDLADFVRERGGGLLMIAGERFAPAAYKDTPLKDVLPIDVTDKPDEAKNADAIAEGYRLELTPAGRMHPIFRFSTDDRETEEILAKLREMYWYASGYQIKRAAEVLAVHPRVKVLGRPGGGGKDAVLDNHPLVVQHFVGAGRVLFFGFDESWRWGFREDQLRFNQFWMESVRYLARTRPGRVELRLDRQTPYRRGEPIKVMVRFPEQSQPPDPRSEVKVVVERRNPLRPGDTEVRTVQLSKVFPSSARDDVRPEEDRPSRYYETLLTQTPEGEYKFWLSEPSLPNPKPRAEAKVLAPPGEMERLRMNQGDMERAAEESGGRFYALPDAGRLVAELPVGTRLTVNAPGPPYLLWNHFTLFVLALGLLTMEWIMRKQKNLL